VKLCVTNSKRTHHEAELTAQLPNYITTTTVTDASKPSVTMSLAKMMIITFNGKNLTRIAQT